MVLEPLLRIPGAQNGFFLFSGNGQAILPMGFFGALEAEDSGR